MSTRVPAVVKNAVARLRIIPGTGNITINKRDAEQYFARGHLVENALAPFKVTDTASKFNVLALCDGGGISGQSGTLRLGITRALLNAGDYRADLKKAGFLTRDARVVERKKYGLKKARRAPHSPSAKVLSPFGVPNVQAGLPIPRRVPLLSRLGRAVAYHLLGKERSYAQNIFGTDGVRGVANADLSCDLAFGLGRAATKFLGPDICIGRDARLSGTVLRAL